jgi:hypothetical protein
LLNNVKSLSKKINQKKILTAENHDYQSGDMVHDNDPKTSEIPNAHIQKCWLTFLIAVYLSDDAVVVRDKQVHGGGITVKLIT